MQSRQGPGALITRKQPEAVLRGAYVERKPQDKHGQLACLEMQIPGTQDSDAPRFKVGSRTFDLQ